MGALQMIGRQGGREERGRRERKKEREREREGERDLPAVSLQRVSLVDEQHASGRAAHHRAGELGRLAGERSNEVLPRGLNKMALLKNTEVPQKAGQ